MSTHDIFLSYSHINQGWVRKVLLAKLEKHGFSVIVDFRDFRAGAFGIEEMERAVKQCRRVILVLTPAYVSSDWCTFENVLTQTIDPAAILRKLIPVLREQCDIPLRLRALHYCDLLTDDEEAWNHLIRDLI